MTTKQKKTLEIIEYFIPDHVKWGHPTTKVTAYSAIGVFGLIQSRLGVSAEEAFFMRSERGKFPKKVKSLPRLVALLWGQRRMALHIQMWKDMNREGLLFIQDFDDEPEYIKKILVEKVFGLDYQRWKETK